MSPLLPPFFTVFLFPSISCIFRITHNETNNNTNDEHRPWTEHGCFVKFGQFTLCYCLLFFRETIWSFGSIGQLLHKSLRFSVKICDRRTRIWPKKKKTPANIYDSLPTRRHGLNPTLTISLSLSHEPDVKHRVTRSNRARSFLWPLLFLGGRESQAEAYAIQSPRQSKG